MPTVTIEQHSPGQFLLKGEINMYTVPELLTASQALFADLRGEVSVDLAAVSRSDSAGLALLLAWMRLAQAHKFAIHFQNLPEQMRQIARVSELEQLLPLS
jgi:phospholipid transport system transporter-binding protein